MGMFDTVRHTDKNGQEIEIQFKSGDCTLAKYKVGDAVPIQDGIHFGYKDEEDGCFVVFNGIIVAVFHHKNSLFDKWGDPVNYPDINI